jgi:cell division protein FtsZ
MGTGVGTGNNRLEDAVKGAFESPLLNDFDLKTAKNVLINITSGNNERGIKMKELETIDEMITQYTGSANRFKKGLIWDDDPEIGDKVRITAIVTGFDMGKLGDITDVNLGNLVIIDRDFQWETTYKGQEVPLPDVTTLKVGFNTAEPTRRFNYTEDTKPCLCVEPGENISELEAVPAIRRAHDAKK